MLLDVMMPEGGMDGFQVCEAIKADEESQSIIVIMLTAKGQEVDNRKGEQVGAISYFPKPLSPLALLNKLEEVLN